MHRPLLTAAILSAATLLAGCNMMGLGGTTASANGGAQPSVAAQTSIIALQTWLMIEQQKATAAGNTSRASLAGSLIGNLTALRTEPNCATRLRLATTVSTGLQAQFPNYQSHLAAGTNLVNVLATGFPGCM